MPPVGTRSAIAVAAARPDAKVTARPPSSAPSAASSAPHAALPSRPYSTAASWRYVELNTSGGFIGAPGTRAGRPAWTATVSAVHPGSRSEAWGTAARSCLGLLSQAGVAVTPVGRLPRSGSRGGRRGRRARGSAGCLVGPGTATSPCTAGARGSPSEPGSSWRSPGTRRVRPYVGSPAAADRDRGSRRGRTRWRRSSGQGPCCQPDLLSRSHRAGSHFWGVHRRNVPGAVPR